MIYLNEGAVIIRDLEDADVPSLLAAELAQGWHVTEDKYRSHLRDRARGACIALAAQLGDDPVGYISVYPDSPDGAFGGRGLPELVDFAVLQRCRKQGIGSRLMDVGEALAGNYADTVYLGVGLHSGYGSAQRMYVRRGYVPDGSGVWFRGSVCAPYTSCVNDDDLVLYLSKRLR